MLLQHFGTVHSVVAVAVAVVAAAASALGCFTAHNSYGDRLTEQAGWPFVLVPRGTSMPKHTNTDTNANRRIRAAVCRDKNPFSGRNVRDDTEPTDGFTR